MKEDPQAFMEAIIRGSQAFVIFADGTYAPIESCIIARIAANNVKAAIDLADRRSRGMADPDIWQKYVVDSVVDIEAMYRDYAGMDEEGA